MPIPQFSDNIAIKMDGEYLSCGSAPIITDGTLMLPLRAVCEKAGAAVEWENGVVKITHKGGVINVPADSENADVNGIDVHMSTKASVYNGTIMIPAEFIADALGYALTYNNGIRLRSLPECSRLTGRSRAFHSRKAEKISRGKSGKLSVFPLFGYRVLNVPHIFNFYYILTLYKHLFFLYNIM